MGGRCDFPIYFHTKAENTKKLITSPKMVQMTSYFHHNFMSIRETFPEDLVKIRHVDVKLRHMTSFSYIFPYYDVIDKNDDVSRKK